MRFRANDATVFPDIENIRSNRRAGVADDASGFNPDADDSGP